MRSLGNISNVIIDNAQAFYSKHQDRAYSFNSARKFFGVPDGAYLFGKAKLKKRFPLATSLSTESITC